MSTSEEIHPESLRRLNALAHEQLAREREVAQAEARLKEAQAALAQVAQRDLPEFMDSIGCALFVTEEGFKVSVREDLRNSIPPENKDTAYDWLEGNDLGACIKRHVGVNFGINELPAVAKCVELLRTNGFDVLSERRVEPATLKRVLRESLAEGVLVPLDLFGAWRERKSVIKVPKE